MSRGSGLQPKDLPEEVIGYTPEEKLRLQQLRELRRRWLKDQELSPREPVLPPRKVGWVEGFWERFLQPERLWKRQVFKLYNAGKFGLINLLIPLWLAHYIVKYHVQHIALEVFSMIFLILHELLVLGDITVIEFDLDYFGMKKFLCYRCFLACLGSLCCMAHICLTPHGIVEKKPAMYPGDRTEEKGILPSQGMSAEIPICDD